MARTIPLVLLALVGFGCDQPAKVPTSPTAGAEPSAGAMLEEKKAEPVKPELAANLPADALRIDPKPSKGGVAGVPAASEGEGDVKLEKVNFDEFLSRIAADKTAKYTMVDAWATWCGPCKENFPHVVEMHKKYGDKGLAVVSLSFDDPAVAKQVSDAKRFLAEKKAVFTNFLLDEEQGVGFEKLDINSIPAVFLYGPAGKLVKRFTMDDPNHQFTYDEVEKSVVALLDGKPEHE
jgi:thiol-disulfide isomerase/thioredoxin